MRSASSASSWRSISSSCTSLWAVLYQGEAEKKRDSKACFFWGFSNLQFIVENLHPVPAAWMFAAGRKWRKREAAALVNVVTELCMQSVLKMTRDRDIQLSSQLDSGCWQAGAKNVKRAHVVCRGHEHTKSCEELYHFLSPGRTP